MFPIYLRFPVYSVNIEITAGVLMMMENKVIVSKIHYDGRYTNNRKEVCWKEG
ncbi:hypothetical protein J2S74_004490 [Evansella vedderi]|uniref:Uncharacterized protein n=1 Tax=Evansella vedderi TaxID=38282 RepID=A0ABU0A1C4_9BACI|nr:hypothetical protein [Evansella vedderi]